jgi:hypothetical protein
MHIASTIAGVLELKQERGRGPAPISKALEMTTLYSTLDPPDRYAPVELSTD